MSPQDTGGPGAAMRARPVVAAGEEGATHTESGLHELTLAHLTKPLSSAAPERTELRPSGALTDTR